MFSSTVLDLATGLIFCFLTVSLATGTVVEAISSALKLRSKTLTKGIGDLLNDPQLTGLAGELYAHGAINPRGPGAGDPRKKEPAYIDRQLFAKAMMDITGISAQVAAAARQNQALPTLDDLHGAVSARVSEVQNPQLHQLLTGIVNRSFGEAERIQGELSEWFDHAMDRVSGAYKRWTQLVGFVAALVLAAGLNVDSIGVAKTLWLQPATAEKIKADTTLKTDDAIKQLSAAIPIGWPNGFAKKPSVGADKTPVEFNRSDWGLAFLGWLITAFATLFGAPFWFDLLQTFIRLKGSGPSPGEKVAGRGAAA